MSSPDPLDEEYPYNHMKPELVKFQRSLFTSDNTGRMMYYNEDRTLTDEVELTKEWVEALFPNGEAKVYRWCRVNENSRMLEIGDEADEDPDW